MGISGNQKKRSLAHYLHRQWIATALGKEAHAKECKRQKELRDKGRIKVTKCMTQ